MTPETLVSLAPELIQLQTNYIAAKAAHDTVKMMEQEVKTRILSENTFLCEDSGERITEPRSDFRMCDDDFVTYCKLCHVAYLERGLNVPDWNTTPDYATHPALHKAEDALLAFGVRIVPDNMKTDVKAINRDRKYRKEALGLLLRLKIA